MNDIVKRLRNYTSDDHERGCQGRHYDCSCGYDSKRDPLMEEAAARIEQLEKALRDALSYSTIGDMPVTIYESARAALGEKA